MRVNAFSVTAGAIAFALSAPAVGQLAPGYSGQSSAPVQAWPVDYFPLIRVMGECAAKLKAKDSAAFLATKPASSEEAQAFRKLFGGQRNMCMQNFVSATLLREHVRGAVAESMYKRLVANRREQEQPAQVDTAQGDVVTLHDFARCYVTGHRNDAHKLLTTTRLGTKEEHAAVASMARDFGPCLPAGRDVEIDPIDIRLAIAEAMYHSRAGNTSS